MQYFNRIDFTLNSRFHFFNEKTSVIYCLTRTGLCQSQIYDLKSFLPSFIKTHLFYLRGAWLWQDPGDGSCHDILPKTSVLFNLEETQVRESEEDSESSLKSGWPRHIQRENAMLSYLRVVGDENLCEENHHKEYCQSPRGEKPTNGEFPRKKW